MHGVDNIECLHVHRGRSLCMVVKVTGEVVDVYIGKVRVHISTVVKADFYVNLASCYRLELLVVKVTYDLNLLDTV